MKREHEIKISTLEIEYKKQMDLCTELNPEPILRFNIVGKLIGKNKLGERILEKIETQDKIFSTIFEFEKSFLSDLIVKNESHRLLKAIGDKTYSISLIGSKDFETLHTFFHDITDRMKMEQEIISSKEKIQQLSIRNEKIRDEEGERIASEIHDGIGADLYGAGFLMQNLNELIADEDIKKKINEIIELVDKVHNDMRNICYRLKPRVLREDGLICVLQAMIDNNNAKFNIKGKVNVSQDIDFDSVELELYRVLQEAINNILKHSKASKYIISFIKRLGETLIIISDDGIGFEIEKYRNTAKLNLGLFNMEERVKNLGGEFKINSEVGEGTTIYIKLNPNYATEKSIA